LFLVVDLNIYVKEENEKMKIFKQVSILAMAAIISGCGSTGTTGSGYESEPITAQSQNADTSAQNDDMQQASETDERITEDQALSAIRNYCHTNNPELQKMEDSGEYTISWDIQSADDSQIVVVYRSYTGALVRYYIDPVTGDTYVTEFVEGITDEEERSPETLNVRDYMD
jgi:hypothetical protein